MNDSDADACGGGITPVYPLESAIGFLFGAGVVRTVAGAVVRGLAGSIAPPKAADTIQPVEFGSNPNSTEHALRHLDDLGLDRNEVMAAIRRDLAGRPTVHKGTSLTGYVTVRGVRLEYRVFGRDNGVANVGRIHD
jgi:hypothetical protein